MSAFDLIAMSPKLQNQFFGDKYPLSETSKSELFNGLIGREMDAIARPIGETLANVGAWELGGVALGKLLGWGTKSLARLLKSDAGVVTSMQTTSVQSTTIRGITRYGVHQMITRGFGI